MILYIHGFRSTIASHKALLLKKYFGDSLLISDHVIIPKQAIVQLEKMVIENKVKSLVASSMGGFYAVYLANKYNIKAVLINPSVKPYMTTEKYIGSNKRSDGSHFFWTKEHLEMLKKLKVNKPSVSKLMVLLQTGDKILDYRIANDFYYGAKIIIQEGGSHRFDNFRAMLPVIKDFLVQKSHYNNKFQYSWISSAVP